jgi:hypothetical protein
VPAPRTHAALDSTAARRRARMEPREDSKAGEPQEAKVRAAPPSIHPSRPTQPRAPEPDHPAAQATQPGSLEADCTKRFLIDGLEGVVRPAARVCVAECGAVKTAAVRPAGSAARGPRGRPARSARRGGALRQRPLAQLRRHRDLGLVAGAWTCLPRSRCGAGAFPTRALAACSCMTARTSCFPCRATTSATRAPRSGERCAPASST